MGISILLVTGGDTTCCNRTCFELHTLRGGGGSGGPSHTMNPSHPFVTLHNLTFLIKYFILFCKSMTGDHVPKILPCSHTLCETCLKILIRDNKLDCPECRVKHEATSGTISFPQNKYIITHIKKKPIAASSTSIQSIGEVFVGAKFGICPQHDRELSLYCKEVGCQKPVCPLCKARFHKNHECLDLDRVKPLMTDIKSIIKDIQQNKEKLFATKREVMERNSECIALIQKIKQNKIKMLNDVYDKLLEEAHEQNSKFSLNIDEKGGFLEEKIAMLNSIEENIDILTITDQGITNNMEAIQDIAKQVKTDFLINAKYIRYSNHETFNVRTMEVLCGRLQSVNLTDQITGNSFLVAVPHKSGATYPVTMVSVHFCVCL